jgi:hypothetical protein
VFELLELQKTDSEALGPILFNKDSVDGIYEIIEGGEKYQFQPDSTV